MKFGKSGQTENGYFTEPPHHMLHHTINHHISQNHHTASHYKPSRQWLLLKRLFWPKPWHYCHLHLFLEEFLNVLIQQFELFWVLALNPRSHIRADLFNSYFFICYLAAPQPIFGHYPGDNDRKFVNQART